MKKNFYLKVFIILSLSIILIYSFILEGVVSITPFGANYTEVSSARAPADSPESIQAQAGNVTELNIFGYSITQSWQGYFGNVSGTIQLADSSDSILYNWSVASPEGEVYAANSTVLWTNIQCFNFSANGTFGNDNATRGSTSQGGMNITQLESSFNIASDDVDGVNETFTLIGGGTHDDFYTNNLHFTEGECRNTRAYSNIGSGISNQFEEVLLYDPNTKIPVFASLIDDNVLGFDNRSHDFEMLVLEDGHGTNTDTTTYYFYVELQ